MIAPLARDDFEDLRAQGLNPTLEDFDRLNQLALRLTEGAKTTCANFPRIGWAGDVPFFEPTIQAFAWYHSIAVEVAENVETENTFWAFALAHAREPGFFDSLTTPQAIEKAVGEWAAKLPATHDEVMRACRYAARGFDDVDPAEPDGVSGLGSRVSGEVTHRADKTEAAKNLAAVETILARACAELKCAPDTIRHETPSRLDRICEAAAVELGKTVTKDEAKLRADYDLTLREIVRRLKAEKEATTSPSTEEGQLRGEDQCRELQRQQP